jgi:hypothetical protein
MPKLKKEKYKGLVFELLIILLTPYQYTYSYFSSFAFVTFEDEATAKAAFDKNRSLKVFLSPLFSLLQNNFLNFKINGSPVNVYFARVQAK